MPVAKGKSQGGCSSTLPGKGKDEPFPSNRKFDSRNRQDRERKTKQRGGKGRSGKWEAVRGKGGGGMADPQVKGSINFIQEKKGVPTRNRKQAYMERKG